MGTEPLVSIVTPSYNQAQYIEETILSVLNQDYSQMEYIVIDGGSTDGTVEILERYTDRLLWVSEPDDGQADAINKGLEMARGDIAAYLNSDDVYRPGAITAVVQCFACRPEVGLVYGDCDVIDSTGQLLGTIAAPEPNLARLIHHAEFIPQPAAFWRRDVLDTLGGFDTTLRYALDYDFFIRVAQAFPALRIPGTLAAFRLHSVSKTVSAEHAHWRESLLISRRYGSGWRSPGYVLRVLRHQGLRWLPSPLQRRVRRWLGRAQDVVALESREEER
ncbi:MAG: glycosyltransferase [Chloroflexi bacterium]|nr:glycosyltransferase [Chloroflexota bacterium]